MVPERREQGPGSFADVARAHSETLYRIALGFCGNHADAQDLAQETLLRAQKAWHGFEGRFDPSTWLYRIASRTCGRMKRRRAGLTAEPVSLEADPALTERLMADVDALDEGLDDEREALLEKLRESVAALPPAFRLPLVLKDIAGLPVEKVAGVLGLKPATVKTRLHRARMTLRARLGKSLPRRPGVPAAYAKQLCVDLLKAKQDALDRGVEMALPDGLICERCRAVFAELDAGLDLCQDLASGDLPPRVREMMDRL